jgi:hypothetical protein
MTAPIKPMMRSRLDSIRLPGQCQQFASSIERKAPNEPTAPIKPTTALIIEPATVPIKPTMAPIIEPTAPIELKTAPCAANDRHGNNHLASDLHAIQLPRVVIVNSSHAPRVVHSSHANSLAHTSTQSYLHYLLTIGPPVSLLWRFSLFYFLLFPTFLLNIISPLFGCCRKGVKIPCVCTMARPWYHRLTGHANTT